MSLLKTTIQISELKSKKGDTVKHLTDFLRDRSKAKVDATEGNIVLNYEEGKETISKAFLRTLLRRFLYAEKLKEQFRVISGGENVFIIKERRHFTAE